MPVRLAALLAVGALVMIAEKADAAMVTIGALKDVTIFQNNVNNSSGGGNGLFAGTNGTGSPRRALIAFDVAGSLPPSAIVTGVQLSLVVGQVAGSGGPNLGQGDQMIGLHHLSASWDEGTAQTSPSPTDSPASQGQGAAATGGDATWNARMYSATTPTLWSTPGGDFTSKASAIAVVGSTTGVWTSTAALVADVQGWLSAPVTNDGWLIKNEDEAIPTSFRAFYSRDVATAGNRPMLTITYQVPEPTALVALTPLVIIGGRMRRRR